MQRVISLKPISVISISPQKQKRIRAHKFSDFPLHSPQCFPQPSHNDDLSIDNDNMPIFVSDELRSWLICNNLEGFLKVVDVEPHPHAEALMEEIEVSKITNKKVRTALGMRRGGFDTVKKVTEEGLRLYFSEYLHSAKAYQTQGGRDEFFSWSCKVFIRSRFC